MKFSIDIIWMNAQKQIVHIENNVRPETYPNTYCPSVNAQYVLEINAGEAEKLQLSLGKQLFF